MLGDCCAGNGFVGVIDCRIDTIQEIVFSGGGRSCNFGGTFDVVSCEDERR